MWVFEKGKVWRGGKGTKERETKIAGCSVKGSGGEESGAMVDKHGEGRREICR